MRYFFGRPIEDIYQEKYENMCREVDKKYEEADRRYEAEEAWFKEKLKECEERCRATSIKENSNLNTSNSFITRHR